MSALFNLATVLAMPVKLGYDIMMRSFRLAVGTRQAINNLNQNNALLNRSMCFVILASYIFIFVW